MSANVEVRYLQNLQHEVQVGNHRLLVDEPGNYGGDDMGPDPYDLMLAALGACTSMTMLIYARRKKWPLENVYIELSHERIHAKDCETCESKAGKVDRIHRIITLEGPLSDEQVDRLKEIVVLCPVHQTLITETQIIDTMRHSPTTNSNAIPRESA
jgi:uncharacterized OsmC-like protein